MKNLTFLKAIRKEPVPYTPVWVMRQAGRYLPEYRALRRQAKNFLEFCKNPELACEATLQPLRRFPLDAAILFSDILTITDALDLGLEFREGEGPHVARPIRDIQQIERLPHLEVEHELAYVAQAMVLIKQELAHKVPVLGFAGSPWTQAAYMIEGQGSKTFSVLKKFLYEQPTALHLLLQKVADLTSDYLAMQIRAGADAVMLFDTWGGLLSAHGYTEFSLRYMTAITQTLKAQFPEIPIILFTKGGALWLEAMVDSGCDMLGLDWTIDIAQARARVGDKVALQGNLDPSVLFAPDSVIESEVKKILNAYGAGSGHVFNLGHGITPDVDPAKLEWMIQVVHEQSRLFH